MDLSKLLVHAALRGSRRAGKTISVIIQSYPVSGRGELQGQDEE
jgi:hypothetical protein